MWMRTEITLNMPSDMSTLPLVRHITRQVMCELGVEVGCVDDVELALAEACANVVEHARTHGGYEVEIDITDGNCSLRVVDRGRGFDYQSLGGTSAADTTPADRGRGITLMEALVDLATFQSRPEAGTVVHLVKKLSFQPGTPGDRLGGPRAGTT